MNRKIRRLVLKALFQKDFRWFVQMCFMTLHPEQKYNHNWHIDCIAEFLQGFLKGPDRRGIINLPPRSLKSIMISVALPAWIMGNDPSKRIIVVCHTKELGSKHANDFRRIVESEWFKRAFPRFKPSLKNTETELQTSLKGFRLTVSVDGPLTGRGADIIIVDDPMKANDAMSDAELEKIIDWYRSTLLSRLDDKENGIILIVMQRLHQFDLCGYSIKTAPNCYNNH